jgi:HD superfamily phosphohydrolase
MYLAGRAVDQLRHYIPIEDRTKHLIQLAGLYHDVGHMSFSHLFDVFLKMNPPSDEAPEVFQHHDHEDRSIYFLRSVNAELQLLSEKEEQFIANAIRGIIPEGAPPYLYQIVCNTACGVDVDKMDYLHRDVYHTGLSGFQSDYILNNMRLDDTLSIAFNRKARRSIKDLFITRKRLFKDLYQHHTALKIDKIHYCCLKYLGNELYRYGENTNDYNIETLIASKEELKPLLDAVAYRRLDHDCSRCCEYMPAKSVKQSGTIKNVRFI